MGAPKQKWTAEEEAALKAGVVKHGAGKWRTILMDPEFSAILRMRSNVDLKDKWRNINVTAIWGSRQKAKLALKKNQLTPKRDGNALALTTVKSDEEIVDVKPLAISSGPLSTGNSRERMKRLDALIMEAITNLKEPSGSDRAAIAAYIEDQYWAPPNFKKLISAKLKLLNTNGKLIKVKHRYRIASNSRTGDSRKGTSKPLTEGRLKDPPAKSEKRELKIFTKSQIASELSKMRTMTAQEAAAAAARAVAEAEVAIAEAEEAAREAEAAEAEAEAAQVFAQAALNALKCRKFTGIHAWLRIQPDAPLFYVHIVLSDRRGLLDRGRLLFGRPIISQVLLGLTVSSMRAYAEDEYEDYDDYADEDEEQLEDAGEEEEDPRSTKEALEYLELRQKFKEALRKKMKKEGQSASQDKRRPSYDNFGSFFGPSKPVIAPRVIQESKSLLENPHLASRVLQSHQNNKKSSSTSNGSRSGFHEQASRVVNQMQTKAQILKDKRDYSFLFSEDAELPAPSKEPPPRNVSVPTSDARLAKPSLPINHVSGSSSRQPAHNGDRGPVPSNSHIVSKPGLNKLPTISKRNTTPLPSKRQLCGNNGIGPGRPRPPPNGSQSRTPGGSQLRISNGLSPRTSNGYLPKTSNGSHSRASNGLQSSTANALSSKNSAGLQSKMFSGVKSKTPAGVPSKMPNKSGYSQATKFPPSSAPGAASGKVSSSVMKHQLDHRREVREPSWNMAPPKRPMAAAKPQIRRPLNQASSHMSSQEQRIKKRPLRQSDDDDDDGDRAISMIRKMFGYNPQRFARHEEDDSDMEANFDEIMKEEKRSARIARKEDEEQLRLIEEEERREHMRKMAKKRKMSH
ncbi:hypothetical protein MLD38_009293 [Melastoma candidum]|uniref:Uncharacterized protein n=1 Tax=Melastoma candidum TaxID=119954 RepID=A0ACB9RX16_9MYRT|nr:hypothetical protein MLD38_009293 [Melastoma candidum]